MTEQEWLKCPDPQKILEFLRHEIVTLVDQEPSKRQEIMRMHLLRIVNPRKINLFACACCRLLWHLLTDERGRKAVEITERYIDGLAAYKEWALAAGDATNAKDAVVTSPKDANRKADQITRAAAFAAMMTAWLDVGKAAEETAVAITWASLALDLPAATQDQVMLLHDIVGNPFRPPDPEGELRDAKRRQPRPDNLRRASIWPASNPCRRPGRSGLRQRRSSCPSKSARASCARMLGAGPAIGEGMMSSPNISVVSGVVWDKPDRSCIATLRREDSEHLEAAKEVTKVAIMKIFVDNQIHLSDFRSSDKPALIQHLNDRDIYDRTLRIPFPYTEANAEEWLALYAKITQEQGRPVHFAIRSADDAVIGGCGFNGLELGKSHLAEVGYWLAKPFWGQGIMTAVVQRMCQHAFEEFGLAKIIAHVHPHNPASARVLEKCGFQEEGFLRRHFPKDGQFLDARLFGLLRKKETKWDGLRNISLACKKAKRFSSVPGGTP